MGGSKSQTIGYTYFMGVHFLICHGPCDSLVQIRADDRVLMNGNVTFSSQVFINQPDAFGGQSREGGVVGACDLMMGEATQGANAYLTAVQGGMQPGYRGLMGLVFKGGQIGANNPYPKPWSFRVRRSQQGWEGGTAWYASKATISLASGAIQAMNPAHIALEAMTNRDWGMGYPMSAFDLPTWQAAADTLFSEGFGLCILWNRQQSIEDFIQSVMNYIGGAIVTSRTPGTAGLIQLKLIRGGYSLTGLPSFDQDDVIEFSGLEATGITGNINELVVAFVDPIAKVQSSVTMQALGSIQAQGVVVSQQQNYPGLPTADLAARVAQRDLRSFSVPLKRLKAKLNRTAYTLTPGDVFLFSWPPLGIVNMPMRVGTVDGGTLTDGAIVVEAVQDIFSLPATTYVVPQPTGWTPPSTTPTAPGATQGFESTYRDLYQLMSTDQLAALSTTDTYAGLYAARPSGLAVNYDVWSRVSPAVFAQTGHGDFTPTGTLQAAIGPFDTSITVTGGLDLNLVNAGTAVLIDSEWMRVDAINSLTGVCTVARGCIDTVPASHAINARVWFGDIYYGTDSTEYFAGESVDFKPLTVTTQGTLDLASAPTVTVPLVGRQALPYPPAFLSINGTRWDQIVQLSGQLTLTWRERNRITEGDTLIDQTVATMTPEAGTTYTVVLKDGAGTTFGTFTGITGTSWTWPTPDDTHTQVQMTLTAVRAGLSSFQSQKLPVTTRVGYGLNYGNDYGSA